MIERTTARDNLVDVLDRVLDKGIVVDAWVRVSLVGIELVTVEAHIVIASIETYRGYAGSLAEPAMTAPERSETVAPRVSPPIGQASARRRSFAPPAPVPYSPPPALPPEA